MSSRRSRPQYVQKKLDEIGLRRVEMARRAQHRENPALIAELTGSAGSGVCPECKGVHPECKVCPNTDAFQSRAQHRAVSYTHLTLPTILLV